MKKKKPTILMFPSWWPSKENPINGIFFKEQMLALTPHFDFVVFRTVLKRCLLMQYFWKKIRGTSLTLNPEENDGFRQYRCLIYTPFAAYIPMVVNYIKVKLHLIHLPDGVGEYLSEKQLKSKIKRFDRLFNKNHFEIDLVYGLTAQDMAINASCAAKSLKLPYVLAEHAPFPWPGHVINNLQKKVIEEADGHFLISNDKLRQIMLQNIKLKNTNYIGNLVDENLFQLNPIKHEKITFVIVAANSFYKNFDMFIETMDILSDIASNDFSVVIAGFGANKGYSKNVDILVEKVKKSKFGDKAELIPSIPRSEMSELYNRCDAFVMTSIQEGQPVSALEAACCGLPIFSTCCGGVEDYISEFTGRIVSVNDSLNMANILNQFLNNEIVFEKQKIRDEIVGKFGKRTFSKNMGEVFNKLIGAFNE